MSTVKSQGQQILIDEHYLQITGKAAFCVGH